MADFGGVTDNILVSDAKLEGTLIELVFNIFLTLKHLFFIIVWQLLCVTTAKGCQGLSIHAPAVRDRNVNWFVTETKPWLVDLEHPLNSFLHKSGATFPDMRRCGSVLYPNVTTVCFSYDVFMPINYG